MSEGHVWRNASSASIVTTVTQHFAGQLGGGATVTMRIVPDKLYAVPFIVPRSLSCSALVQWISTAASGVTAQLAVYGVECLSLPMPTRVIAQGNDGFVWRGFVSDITSLNTRVFSIPPAGSTFVVSGNIKTGYSLAGNRLYWFACAYTGSAAIAGIDQGFGWPIFGYDMTSLSLAYTHLVTSWSPASVTLPNTFPAVWTATCSAAPAIGVRIAS